MHQVDVVSLIVIALGLAIAAGIPALFPRLPVPGVVLEIMFGAIVGPQVLGFVHPHVTLNFLSNLGLGMLFLMAGFEIDPGALRGKPIHRAVMGWIMSAVIASAAAALLFATGVAVAPEMCALALSTTAIGALMPVLRDSGLLRPPYGPLVLAGGAVGEAAPVIVLSLLLARGNAPLQSLIMIGFAAATLAAVLLAARARQRIFAPLFARTMKTSGQFPMRLALCLLIVLALVAERLHIELVLGGFAAGAIMRAALSDEEREDFGVRLDGLGSAFLVPVFFIASGVGLDVAALFASPAALAMVPVYAFLMLAVRGAPAMILYRDLLDSRHRMGLALHFGTQISLVVPITAIAVHRGIMPGSQAAAMVGGAILTTVLYPALAKRVLQPSGAEKAIGAGEQVESQQSA